MRTNQDIVASFVTTAILYFFPFEAAGALADVLADAVLSVGATEAEESVVADAEDCALLADEGCAASEEQAATENTSVKISNNPKIVLIFFISLSS
jgi:hypothetical protein